MGILLICVVIPVSLGGCRDNALRKVNSSESKPAAAMSTDLAQFLDRYFDSWSVGDMETYGALFHPDARIFMTMDGIVIYKMTHDEFVDLQRREKARRIMTERMTTCTVEEDARAASVTASWELEEEGKLTTGIDRFTLIRDSGGAWKILTLLFYIDKY